MNKRTRGRKQTERTEIAAVMGGLSVLDAYLLEQDRQRVPYVHVANSLADQTGIRVSWATIRNWMQKLQKNAQTAQSTERGL
jgi:hypothetical protein